jgi:predicted RNase H-like nuclease (RuvC/YqgF family)
MNSRVPELLNRKTKGWMNITYKEFDRDIKILQQTIREQQKQIEQLEKDKEWIYETFADI